MNADTLLIHFNRISEAPDAIPRLRRFILDLAVRGKLVEQDPDDEPASDLLEHVHLERVRLLKEGTVKKDKPGLPIGSEEQPFNKPMQWQLVRLGQVLEMINGRAFKPTDWLDTGLPIVRIQNLNNAQAPFNYCDPKTTEDRHLIRDGEFLISWSGTPGTSFGAFIWKRGLAALNQHIFRCIQIGESFKLDFLRLAINSQLDVLIAQAQGGVGLQHVTKGTLESLPLPLPPLAEQQRIVTKVDELMALCDQLETSRNERDAWRDRLVTSSLNRISTTKADKAKDATRFHLNLFPRLTTRIEHIKQLRQCILNIAVCGQLVPQDQNDDPAATLLNCIAGGEASTRRNRNPEVGQPSSGEIPFPCPIGWEWTTVQGLLDRKREISYGVIKLGEEPLTGGVPTLRCSDVKPGFIDLSAVRKVSESIEAQYVRTRLDGGEILINIRGTLGGVAKVPQNLRGFNVAREVAVIPIAKDIFADFFVYLMLSQYFWESIQGNLRGIAYKGLNLGTLREFPVPIPPLAEQHRIVAKVDELMALCDQLEARLTTTETDSRRLLEAVLRDALNTSAMTN